MKKGLGKRLLIGFLTVAMSLFWTVGCSVHGPTLENRLESVPNDSILASLQGTDLHVEWGEVPNATSYLVTYTDTTLTVEAPTTSAVFRYVEYVSGSITISIIACASDYLDSVATSYTFTPDEEDTPTTLFKPTGLSVSDGVLAWTNVKNATSYTVSDGNKSATVNTNSINLAANGLTVPTSGSITYTVVAKADGYNDSAKASYTYTKCTSHPPHEKIAV
ncbi:MAG: hypothetical protein K2L88_00445, partial [Clostridiales bacterium]|nr:hypothetical protein [Clostridiales bacterium]